jgi:hypothetical protein
MSMPAQIKLGVTLLSLSVVVHAFAVMQQAVPNPMQLLGVLFTRSGIHLLSMTILPSVLPIFLIVMICYRKNWARFLFLAITVIGIISGVWGSYFLPSTAQLPYWSLAVGFLLEAIGVGCLFLASSSAWFKRQLP